MCPAEKNVDIFHEKGGGISLQNQRLINQSQLSSVVPEFISQLVVPAKLDEFEKTFPVQRINGFTWAQAQINPDVTFGNESIHFSFEDNVDIAIQTIEQIRYLYETYGVVLADRNKGNIMIESQNLEKQKETGLKYRVWQVDCEEVYDAVNDTSFLNNDVYLPDRKGKFRPEMSKDFLRVKNLIATNVGYITRSVSDLTQNYGAAINPAKIALVDAYRKQWNYDGRKYGTNQFLTFDESLSYLKSLRT